MKTLTVRVSEEDLALWKEAAWVRKVTLSQWTRSVLTATAERTLEQREPAKQ